MTAADRPLLIRCGLLLGGLAWILPAAVLALAAWFLHDLGGLESVRYQATDEVSISLGIARVIEGNILTAFTLAIVGFAALALGGLLATFGLITVRRAVTFGGPTASIVLGFGLSGSYLIGMSSLILGACLI